MSEAPTWPLRFRRGRYADTYLEQEALDSYLLGQSGYPRLHLNRLAFQHRGSGKCVCEKEGGRGSPYQMWSTCHVCRRKSTFSGVRASFRVDGKRLNPKARDQ